MSPFGARRLLAACLALWQAVGSLPASALDVADILEQARSAATPPAPAAPGAVSAAAENVPPSVAAPSAETVRDRSNLWVFIVGLLEWRDSASYGAFPKTDRRDAMLAGHFASIGVPPDHIVFLRDGEATLGRIRDELARLLARAGRGDSLFLYYAGHGGKEDSGTYFVPYDARGALASSGWSVASIFDAIDGGFRGDAAFLSADACHSGALASEARRRSGGRVSYAVVASAEENSLSTDQWTFTDALLAGLRGDPRLDEDGDGVVRLGELARYAERQMALREKQMAAWAATGRFGPRTRVADAAGPRAAEPPQAPPPDPRVRPGDAVEAEWNGAWYPARVLEVRLGLVRVHYDAYPESDDEWLAPDRVRGRRQKAAANPLPSRPGLARRT